MRTRLLLALSLGLGVIALRVPHAHAAGAGEEDEEEGDDEGGDEGDDEGDFDDSEDEDPKSQPPVTAGGLFTMKTYPIRELERPLTMTQKITQLKVSLGTDLSAKGAFATGGLSLEGVYGVHDNFMLVGGFTNAYNLKQFSIYFGFEGALAYDVFDIRLAANLHRFAIPRFCGSDPDAPTTCTADTAALPSGNYDAAGTQFSVDLGFPFRYSFTPQIAIVALQTLVTIDFNGQERGDPTARAAGTPAYCSGVNADMTDAMGNPLAADPNNCIENGSKPDFNPSIGVATNPVPPLSLVIFGQLRIPDFDTSAGNFQVPVTGRVQFSPNHKLDFGLEFTLLNVKPPQPQTPIDNRFLSLFLQARM